MKNSREGRNTYFEGYDNLGNILFVNSMKKKKLSKYFCTNFNLKDTVKPYKNSNLSKKEQVAKMFDNIVETTIFKPFPFLVLIFIGVRN